MSAVVPMTTARRLDRADGIAVAEKRYLIDATRTPWAPGDFRRIMDGQPADALALAPSAGDLDDYLGPLKIAASSPPDPRPSILMVGMLVDAFPNSRASGAFIDAATHDAVSMGFTPYDIATACQRLRRGSKFLPSIAEFLDECARAKRTTESAISLAERMRDRLEQARLAVAQHGDPNEPRP